MENEMLNKIAPPIEPLYDTWGGKKDAGSWCIAPSFDFTSLSTEEVNAWFATSVVETLDAFSDLARAWRVYFNTIYRDDVEGVKLEWQPGDSYQEYVEKVLKAIREYPAPIYSVDIQVDLFAYFRTNTSPDLPVPAWVRLASEFVIWGGSENPQPYLCFNVDHTLFCSLSKDCEDNKELFLLNKPLLENALRRWEERVGSIRDVNGLSGIYKYGFLPEI
jgi:hypothetical protein